MIINAMKLALEALENASPAAWASRVDSDTMKSIWRKHAEALEGLREVVQATQPAEVTDEQIESCALEAGFSVESTGSIWAVDGYVGTRVDPGLRKFAKAILALRPVQVPMTDEQVDSFMVDGRLHWLGKRQLIRAIEAHHGIKPKEQA